jgi:hypothetical protein
VSVVGVALPAYVASSSGADGEARRLGGDKSGEHVPVELLEPHALAHNLPNTRRSAENSHGNDGSNADEYMAEKTVVLWMAAGAGAGGGAGG